MATKKVCDICEKEGRSEEAVTTMEFKTDLSTALKLDLCQKHFERVKRFMNKFTDGDKENEA